MSGLITAYKAATKDALDNAVVIEKTSNDVYRIEFEYVLMNDVMRLLKDEGLEQFNQRFELNCSIDFSVRKARSERVAEAFKKIRGTTLTYLRTE
jgi:putative IMPACT (imprinted ancient) family translation regulator